MTRLSAPDAFKLALDKFLAGDLPLAKNIGRQILSVEPNHSDTLHLMGAIAVQEGQLPTAIDLFQKAIGGYSSAEDLAEVHNNLGIAYAALKNFDQAILCYQNSFALRPVSAETQNNLGVALQAAGRQSEAEDSLRKAIVLRPDYADALSNLGKLLHVRGEYAAAIQALERSQSLNPQLTSAHWNMSHLQLLQGNGERGWREYEWRLKIPEHQHTLSRLALRRWDGSPLDGRQILLHCEQGFGDTIHFCRYVKEVAARGGKITIVCPLILSELLKPLPGVDRVICQGEPPRDIEVHCPMLSLPFTLGMYDPWWPGAYLGQQVSPKNITDLSSTFSNQFKIGLVWQGRLDPPGRSIPLASFKPLAMRNVQLFGLQIGGGREQIQQVDFDVIDATRHVEDFADLARVLRQMDLIISIDTAAAQLAGAMGLRVWTLLKKFADWRWRMGRSDSPWYPTMRLFRQERDGEWPDVVARVREKLSELIK